MNYASLTTQIQNYANRTDAIFIGQIPNFINQAMNRIYSEAKSLGFEIVYGGNLTANQSIFPKPNNWKETISFSITNNNQVFYLFPRSYEFGSTYWPTPGQYALPKFYADKNYDSFTLFPGPDQNYSLTLIYRGLPDFDVQHTTNFLTDRYPSLLLYASLLEAISFLKDDERIPVFESLYNRALQDANRDKQVTITDRTTKRDTD